MVDMKRTPAEKAEDAAEVFMPTPSDYPYGLSMSLTEDELSKLDLADADLKPGDMVHLHCMATVTSVSARADASNGDCCRVELQVTHISAEDEEDEDEESEVAEPMSGKDRRSRLYRG